MEQVSFNLARKWRSAQFQEIVGQDLVVRILQNSLFKNQFFPVYLMSGQRGCGKTTTARVFAAAVNCFQLPEFQKNPKIQIPCLQCASCVAFKQGQHPDFIEIDAASYTGVENIRNIIDTSSFLPVLSRKKIYLIDEVHMLSKAAFNALLKLLEEPSKSVLFILATTEYQKLPDTVRSRCFQLLFSPVVQTQVVEHLKNICQTESIAYEQAGLEIIAQTTQGSLRDAINLLEQARFAQPTVTKASVLLVLGYVDDAVIYNILSALMHQNVEELFVAMTSFEQKTISSEYLLKRIQELLYDCLLIKYGASPKYDVRTPENIIQTVASVNVSMMMEWFDQLCQLDIVMNKTSKKQLLLESLLLRLAAQSTTHHQAIGDEQKKK